MTVSTIVHAQTQCQNLDLVLQEDGAPVRVKQELLRQLREGTPAEYIEIKSNDTAATYVSVARLFEKLLGLSSPAMLTWSSNDLRFLPYAQQDSDLVLVALDDNMIPEERLALIIATARRLSIGVSVVLTPQSRLNAAQFNLLSSSTGGKVLDLSTCQ